MGKPCKHGDTMIISQCRVCFWCNDKSDKGRRYREIWEVPEPLDIQFDSSNNLTPISIHVPTVHNQVRAGNNACVYLAEDTKDRIKCSTCRGSVDLKVLGCIRYGRCTIEKQVDGIACCSNCESYQPLQASESSTNRRVKRGN